jgi:hypothetical protein
MRERNMPEAHHCDRQTQHERLQGIAHGPALFVKYVYPENNKWNIKGWLCEYCRALIEHEVLEQPERTRAHVNRPQEREEIGE